ncbi:unnamed protein product, partial [Brassica oleracea var. botrytis]
AHCGFTHSDISTTHEANRWCARTFSFHKPCLPMMKKKQCWSTMIGALLCFTPQEGDVLQGYSDDDNDSDHKNGDEHALASSPLPLSLKFKPSNVVNP